MTHPIVRFLDGLYLACIWISGLALVVMCMIIPMGVFARYVLGFGAQWPEPVAILMMVVFTFFGAAAAYRAGAHIAVSMLTDRLPAALEKACAGLVHLAMLAASGFVLVWGMKLVQGTMGQTISELPWLPVGITYLALPLGSLVTLLFVLEHMVFGPQHLRPVVTFDHEPEVAEVAL
ncbi:MAG: C4-dicarboxylate transporter [Ramlibacter sp.]|jgi:TRAP-type C4-dicarboxylate transport system permease small subunit|uniref:TRAP transporter small permease n=1 Tax=Ramlibacter sp. TaxID=1917967 RepID=UPI0026179B76|nr:TRAP transporter small permease [Ramlibacter sp.]MDB5749801.1 C4-dicarboxylate transporter [Ramlibacter sp.]